jgi:hypothetical protein
VKSTDRFLIGFVVAIIVLVVVALAVAFNRPEATYQAEDSPEGVAHNYLLALQREDYERAYDYLSPELVGYPASLEDFVRDVEGSPWQFGNDVESSLRILNSRVTGQLAVVEVQVSRFYGGSLFDSSQSTWQFEMQLQQETAGWRIIDSNDYFASCWGFDEGCR